MSDENKGNRFADEHHQLRESVNADMERIRKESAGTQDKDLLALKALAEAATPGPWESEHHRVFDSNGGSVAEFASTRGMYEPEHANRDYIAAANPTAILSLISRVEQAEAALADMEARKDAAYDERNQVVAALAKCFRSGVARTAIEGWSEDWHGCVYIDLPTGQASWHFHDSQAHLFNGLPQYEGKWDGHDTPEKYRRVNALKAHPTPAVDLSGLTRKQITEAIALAAGSVLHSYKLTTYEDSDGEQLPLVDHLCNPAEVTIQSGKAEVELIVDAIGDEFERIAQSLLSSPVVREKKLTDERILTIADDEAINSVTDERRPDNATIVSFARAIEREVLATGKGLDSAEWHKAALEVLTVGDTTTPSTPSQAWEGELPEPDVIAYTCIGDNDAYSAGTVRKAIGAAVAGVLAANRDAVRDAVAQALDGVYYCGRVWCAWQVGTMTEDDFTPAAEVDDVLDEITDAAIRSISSNPVSQQDGEKGGAA